MKNSSHEIDVPTMLWKRFAQSAVILFFVAILVALRLAITHNTPIQDPLQRLIELEALRLGLLVTFHIAPLLWAISIYRGSRQGVITTTLDRVIQDLRMPLAAWLALCLLAGFYFWPLLDLNLAPV
jgi:hypothetical protein